MRIYQEQMNFFKYKIINEKLLRKRICYIQTLENCLIFIRIEFYSVKNNYFLIFETMEVHRTQKILILKAVSSFFSANSLSKCTQVHTLFRTQAFIWMFYLQNKGLATCLGRCGTTRVLLLWKLNAFWQPHGKLAIKWSEKSIVATSVTELQRCMWKRVINKHFFFELTLVFVKYIY